MCSIQHVAPDKWHYESYEIGEYTSIKEDSRRRLSVVAIIKNERGGARWRMQHEGERENGTTRGRTTRRKSLIETDMATAGVRLQFRAMGPVKLARARHNYRSYQRKRLVEHCRRRGKTMPGCFRYDHHHHHHRVIRLSLTSSHPGPSTPASRSACRDAIRINSNEIPMKRRHAAEAPYTSIRIKLREHYRFAREIIVRDLRKSFLHLTISGNLWVLEICFSNIKERERRWTAKCSRDFWRCTYFRRSIERTE